MMARLFRAGKLERRARTLAVLIVVQALCALFFIGDVIADFSIGGPFGSAELMVEAVAACALCAGVWLMMVELRGLLGRMDSMATGLRAASGEMAAVIEGFFDAWSLTAAERDVALLLLKGLDNEVIAGLRGTAKGTVRAQTASIYAKAGVDGRAQLISVFLEELLADAPPAAKDRMGG